ncbi:MAG: hypothetical protein ACLFVU_10925 [Phycisphaerae bacterium]
MKPRREQYLLDWLFANAGPIIRWRLVQDHGYPVSNAEGAALRDALLATKEVQRWLGNLGSRAVHGSADTNAENAMAKLVEYGLRAGMPQLDQKMLPYIDMGHEFADCFLVAAGYGEHKLLADRFAKRLAALHRTAKHGDYDFYLSPAEACDVPKAWRDKPIYRPEFSWGNEGLPVPNCCDLYALAHWQPANKTEQCQIEDVMAYICHPSFQATTGGYFWNRRKHSYSAARKACLACLTPQRLVLSVELFARFAQARESDWFRRALADLEQYRTTRDTYIFPRDYLREQRNCYYLYGGSHMGLGENRRQRAWVEIESTFRMLTIQRLMRT